MPPHAADVTVSKALQMLEGPFQATAEAIAKGRYAFWLGSGISLGRLPPLKIVVGMVLEFLRKQGDPTNPDCRFNKSLIAILSLRMSNDEIAAIDFGSEFGTWPNRDLIAGRLVTDYARMLEQVPDGKEPDFLVWDAIDVPGTYGNAATVPDVEHLCLALLISEGAAPEIASANWDDLIEKAVSELSASSSSLKVVVHPEDVRDDDARSSLYKFHGCAVRARDNQDKYRPKLVARSSQINGFLHKDENRIIAGELVRLVTSRPTFMLGLSAQDSNIQGIFADAEQRMEWPWPSDPLAFVFSENDLGFDQKILLQNVYHRFLTAANRATVMSSGLIKAFAKTLLPALWLHVLYTKMSSLLVSLPNTITEAIKADLTIGLKRLLTTAANSAVVGQTEEFVRAAAATFGRGIRIFHTGLEPAAGEPIYSPVSALPVHKMLQDENLSGSGLKELSVALGLLGVGAGKANWRFSLTGPGADHGAIRVSNDDTSAEVFFAANSQSALRLVSEGNVGNHEAAIIIHSHEIPATMTRSPRNTFGRTNTMSLREVSIQTLMNTISDPDELFSTFRNQAAI